MKDKADRIPDFVVNYLIRIIHQDEINYILETYHDLQGVDFMEALVGYFNVELVVKNKTDKVDSTLKDEANLVRLNMKNEEIFPAVGKKYIFVSNHPLGGFDGICLSYLLGKQYDGKVRCFVNDLLLNIPNLQSIFVPINKHGTQSKEAALKAEEAYLSDNHIITFPAGLCSRKHKGTICDLEWKKSFIQKAISYERDIVPIHFEGRNSNFFYRFANIRKFFNIKINLEMLYLPDELFSQKNKTFNIHIGKPIPWQTFDSTKKASEWASCVKEEVYKLATI